MSSNPVQCLLTCWRGGCGVVEKCWLVCSNSSGFQPRSYQYHFNEWVSEWVIQTVRFLWKLSQAPANVIFCVYKWFHLNFLEQLPLVEQYHVNISSTWLDPERVIGQQLVSLNLFLILWRLLRYNKSISSNELNSPNYSILFSMVFELFLCELDGYIYI